jgi:nitrogen fixation NifU-like protein
MAETINLQPFNDLQENIDIFRKLIKSEDLSEAELDKLGDVSALSGVRKFPVRIKCAMLSWVALEEILSKKTK